MDTEINKLSIIGYSGHSYVCIDVALENSIGIIGYYDTHKKKYNPYGLKYLGRDNGSISNSFICIGDNSKRQSIYNSLFPEINEETVNLIHPRSVISNKVNLETLILICAGAVVNPLADIGTGCIINTNAVIEHECKIGNFVHIAPSAVLAGNVTVGDRTLVGANSIVKEGVNIGNDVIIGAGAVILKDVLEGETVIGNPAKALN